MKLSTIIFAVAAAEEKKVPPRHPLNRLARLTEFSQIVLTDYFDFLPSQQSWINKFASNAERMERNFQRGEQRCGFYDENQLPHGGPERKRRSDDELDVERLSNHPAKAITQITTGFRKWAERYLSQCSGQRNSQYQVNRMTRWNAILQAHFTQQYGQS